MIHVSRACALAVKAIETAEQIAAGKRLDGGMRYRAVDPRAGLETDLLIPAGDDLEQGAMCSRCFDTGLIAILLDGAPARAGCECPKGEPWREKVAAYRDVFPPPPPVERPRHANDIDVEVSRDGPGQIDFFGTREEDMTDEDRRLAGALGSPGYGEG